MCALSTDLPVLTGDLNCYLAYLRHLVKWGDNDESDEQTETTALA